ncbi:MAG TPA: glycoside hydrolase family 97 catalytic domain-containing protein [Opitutaceae bacterium]|nr:glycoside hydrolase family 97 catalytic domain-containing protein [Opitutaceae bacterium]
MISPKVLLPIVLSLTSLHAGSVSSPDGKLSVEFALTEEGAPVYQVKRDGESILQQSRLGLVRDDADFSRGLASVGESESEPVEDRYEILTAKRRHNTYRANRKTFQLATAGGARMDVIFQVSDDGVAFRYRFPEMSEEPRSMVDEVSSFHFLPGTLAWLQPMSIAKEGWMRTFPSYEEFYEKGVPAGTPSNFGAGWVFPALFKSGDTWLLVSETGLDRTYCGARLRHESPNGEYSIGFPDPRETIHGRPANPTSTLPWTTPWRLIAIGDLKTVAESMLGVDLAPAAAAPAGPEIVPGRSSWSWVLLKDEATVFDVQKEFIDYAADMGWEYCLVDALWDVQIGDERVAQLSEYARTKGVGLLLWYNSNGGWNDAPQTPKNRLLTQEIRAKEFAWLKSIGIKGLKVDFFGGDGQPVIQQYLDLIEEAAPYGISMNFHGATIPRGWQRTYPNLMTMESIKGMEFITFEQRNADEEPAHATMLPFTRNVFDPMDFTPVAMEGIPNIERRTTSAFELALAVVFTSGIQHFAETPAGMAKMPDYVREFMRDVPSVWDDVRFLDGYPGKHVVMARLGDGRWHIAGINGTGEPVALSLDVSFLPQGASCTLITDGDTELFARTTVKVPAGWKLPLTMKPRGGFVLVVDK